MAEIVDAADSGRPEYPQGLRAGAKPAASFDHVYVWGNNSVRATYKGRHCRVIARLRMNSVLIEFSNGERTVTSRHAVQSIPPGTPENLSFDL